MRNRATLAPDGNAQFTEQTIAFVGSSGFQEMMIGERAFPNVLAHLQLQLGQSPPTRGIQMQQFSECNDTKIKESNR